MSAVAVVALGDLARSPRMLAHVRCLARHGQAVELIGYVDRPLEVPSGVRVHALHPLPRAPEGSGTARFIATSGLRMGALHAELDALLLRLRPRAILAQNPPSFPTLSACALAARVCRAQFLVDWHNYGHANLALRLPNAKALVSAARGYERVAAAAADAHLCVSEAMQRELRAVGVDARVLYDRPTRALPIPARAASRSLVCPTGFTADEDLPLLLAALNLLDAQLSEPLDVYITGDGPLREDLEARVAATALERVRVHFGYFPRDEYAALLTRADLGISLHRSSSGVDLAMKVVDMFEARLPVCALDHGASLPEQVQDGETGVLFRSAEQLAALLSALLGDPQRIARMRTNIEARWRETWNEHWDRIAAPLLGLEAP